MATVRRFFRDPQTHFFLYGKDGFFAIEVKASRKIHPGDTQGLRAFLEDYPRARPLLIYRGRERLRVANVLCVPCEEFLGGLVPGRALPPLMG